MVDGGGSASVAPTEVPAEASSTVTEDSGTKAGLCVHSIYSFAPAFPSRSLLKFSLQFWGTSTDWEQHILTKACSPVNDGKRAGTKDQVSNIREFVTICTPNLCDTILTHQNIFNGCPSPDTHCSFSSQRFLGAAREK